MDSVKCVSMSKVTIVARSVNVKVCGSPDSVSRGPSRETGSRYISPSESTSRRDSVLKTVNTFPLDLSHGVGGVHIHNTYKRG